MPRIDTKINERLRKIGMKKGKSIVYHKSTCITCKNTLSEIQRMRLDIEKRDFFKEPLTEEELKKIIKMSGMKPAEMIRKRDKMYKELNLDSKKYSDAQIIKLMVKNPGLIARPIIISNNQAFVGKSSINELKKN